MSRRLIPWLLLLVCNLGIAKTNSGLNGYLGFGPGGLGLGADYERTWDKHATWGIYAHSYTSSDDGQGGLGVGGYLRPGFRKGSYYLRITMGAGSFGVTSNGESFNTVGPMMGIGLKKKFSAQFSAGLETYRYYGWFGDLTGNLLESSMVFVSYPL